MAAQIRVGALGNIGDWLLAEELWRQGIYVDELGKVVGSLPFGASICSEGFPFDAVVILSLITPPNLLGAVSEIMQIPAGMGRHGAACFVLVPTAHQGHLTELPEEVLKGLAVEASKYYWWFPLEELVSSCTIDETWLTTLDEVGRNMRNTEVSRLPQGFLRVIATAYLADPKKVGLLRILSIGCMVMTPTEAFPVPSFQSMTDPRAREYALLVNLVLGSWAADDLSEISELVRASLAIDPLKGSRFLAAIERSHASLERRESLMLAILDRIDDGATAMSQAVIGSLNEVIKRRTSRLSKNRSQLELGFLSSSSD